jgi:chromosome segregation ATPase
MATVPDVIITPGEVAELRGEISRGRAIATALRTELTAARASIGALEARAAAESERATAASALVVQLRAELDRTLAGQSQLEAGLRDAEADDRAADRRDLDALRRELEQAGRAHAGSSAELLQQKQALADLIAISQERRLEIVQLTESLAKAQEVAESLRIRNAHLEAAAASSTANGSEEVEELRRELADAWQRSAESEEASRHARAAMEAMQRDASSFKDQLAHLSHDRDELRARLTPLTQERDELAARVTELEEFDTAEVSAPPEFQQWLDDAEAKLQRSEQRRKDASARVEALEAQIVRLKEQAVEVDSARRAAQQRLKEQQGALNRALTELQAVQSLVEEARRMSKALSAPIEVVARSLTGAFSGLESEIERLSTRLLDREDRIRQLEIERARSEVAVLTGATQPAAARGDQLLAKLRMITEEPVVSSAEG